MSPVSPSSLDRNDTGVIYSANCAAGFKLPRGGYNVTMCKSSGPRPMRAVLAAAIALALYASAPSARADEAAAADAATPAGSAAKKDASEDATKLYEVVESYRDSLERAIELKRAATGQVDVIMAEDIGKFPDLNLAESLQRVPGVSIARDAGEGRNISVRGLGADFTRVRLNGMEGLSTTGGTDSSGGNNRGRGFDFNVFASELFNKVEVHKTSSADVEEGSLGATVDL